MTSNAIRPAWPTNMCLQISPDLPDRTSWLHTRLKRGCNATCKGIDMHVTTLDVMSHDMFPCAVYAPQCFDVLQLCLHNCTQFAFASQFPVMFRASRAQSKHFQTVRDGPGTLGPEVTGENCEDLKPIVRFSEATRPRCRCTFSILFLVLFVLPIPGVHNPWNKQ